MPFEPHDPAMDSSSILDWTTDPLPLEVSSVDDGVKEKNYAIAMLALYVLLMLVVCSVAIVVGAYKAAF